MTNQNEHVRQFFDNIGVYLSHSYGISLRVAIVRDLLGELRNQSVLDIGCGNGAISLQFAHESNRLTLIDLSANMLDVARAQTPISLRHTVSYVNQDFLEHDLDDGYDTVLCLGVLAHIHDSDRVFNHLWRLVKPGGVCIIQFTDQEKLVAKINRAYFYLRQKACHVYSYNMNWLTDAKIRDMLAQHNFQVMDSHRYSLLLPGMGILPDNVLYRYQHATLSHSWLSRLGSDVILKITRF